MADTKANMLLTVSTIVITFTAPHVLDPQLRWAAGMVCLSSLVTVILAAYAVMPKVNMPRRIREAPDIRSKGFNLLFFGDFVRMDYEQFEQEMEKVLNDPNLAYEQAIREVYTMGKFLAKQKYRYISLAYMVFIVGLVLSGLALLGSALFSRGM